MQLENLVQLRQGAARDAINASALAEVMQALRRRSIPTKFKVIETGEPRRYRWRQEYARFCEVSDGYSTSENDLMLTLLGPSGSLVQRHKERLPVSGLAILALSFMGRLHSITPSNQLSYIAKFQFHGQGILISGDAGCVDFINGRNIYHHRLINSLLPLHVIQVAHHAGHNHHFYRVLHRAGYFSQEGSSFLLISHGTRDEHRPSDAFEEFILEVLESGSDPKLLFTSKPRQEKVSKYKNSIHSVVGNCGDVGDVGDVCMEYEGELWSVINHAIYV